MKSIMEPYSPSVIFAMRVAAALLFFQHRAEKLFGFAGSSRVPDLFTQRGLAGFLETIGPLLLLLGVFPRLVAFILCGEMAVAYFQAWAPRGFWPIANGGEEAVLFCYFYLWMVTAGAGVWSLDSWLAQRSGHHVFREWKRKLTQVEPFARSFARIVVGFLIVEHGARKIFQVLPAIAGRRNAPPVAIDGLPAFTGYIDLVVGVLLIIGLFARPAALIAAEEMMAAYFVVAALRGPWPIRNGGGEALMHVVISMYLAVMGAGILSLDQILGKVQRTYQQSMRGHSQESSA